VLYECHLPIDGSLDKLVDNLTIANGYPGHECSVFKTDNPMFFKYCKKKLIYGWAVGMPVSHSHDKLNS